MATRVKIHGDNRGATIEFMMGESGNRLKTWGVAVGIGALALVVYALTAQRGISWQDSGEYQYKFLAGKYDWEVGAGIARLHPGYILITRGLIACLPFLSVPYVCALSSGVGMAVALGALVFVVQGISGSLRAACLAAVLLGGAHMAWWLSALAEVYTWSLAFLMLELLCLVYGVKARSFGWFAAALFFNGCHFSVHNFALLNLPVYALLFFLFFWRRASNWLVCAGVWCLGALPILIPIIRHGLETRSLSAVIQSALFGEVFQDEALGLNVLGAPLWLENMALSSCSFFNPCWLYAMAGMILGIRGLRAWKGASGASPIPGALAVSLGALTVIHFGFWARYTVPDQATFMLPTLGLLAVWAGIGAAGPLAGKRSRLAASLAVSVVFSALGPLLYRRTAEWLVPPRSRVPPFRDEFRYWAYPWKHNENSAEQFVTAMSEAGYPEGMVAWVDTTAVAPLMAAQAMGRLPASWSWLTYWQNKPDDVIERRLRESPDGGYVLSPVSGYVAPVIKEKSRAFEKRELLYRIVW